MTKPNVFITNNGGHDYTPAKEFGELRFLSQGHIQRFHITKMMRSFCDAMKDSSDSDYIVAGGPSTMLAIAVAIFAKKHGKLNLLIWQQDDEIGGRYICRKTLIF